MRADAALHPLCELQTRRPRPQGQPAGASRLKAQMYRPIAQGNSLKLRIFGQISIETRWPRASRTRAAIRWRGPCGIDALLDHPLARIIVDIQRARLLVYT